MSPSNRTNANFSNLAFFDSILKDQINFPNETNNKASYLVPILASIELLTSSWWIRNIFRVKIKLCLFLGQMERKTVNLIKIWKQDCNYTPETQQSRGLKIILEGFIKISWTSYQL